MYRLWTLNPETGEWEPRGIFASPKCWDKVLRMYQERKEPGKQHEMRPEQVERDDDERQLV